jgi:hypothetical protein
MHLFMLPFILTVFAIAGFATFGITDGKRIIQALLQTRYRPKAIGIIEFFLCICNEELFGDILTIEKREQGQKVGLFGAGIDRSKSCSKDSSQVVKTLREVSSSSTPKLLRYSVSSGVCLSIFSLLVL